MIISANQKLEAIRARVEEELPADAAESLMEMIADYGAQEYHEGEGVGWRAASE